MLAVSPRTTLMSPFTTMPSILKSGLHDCGTKSFIYLISFCRPHRFTRGQRYVNALTHATMPTENNVFQDANGVKRWRIALKGGVDDFNKGSPRWRPRRS